MEKKVYDHPNLRKIDNSYVVNDNKTAYSAALKRNEMISKLNRLDGLEIRMKSIESNLETIINLIKGSN